MTTTETGPQFQIRATPAGSYEHLQEIFDACFGRKVDENYFRWKYLKNPAGPVRAFEALHEGRVAAFYGILPETYLLDGDEARTYQSMDTMTHPDYQRLGLFSRLAKETYSRVAEEEGSLRLMGIPGIRALPGFVKLGWKHAHSFRFLFQHSTLLRWGGPSREEFAPLRRDDRELARYFEEREPLVRKGIREKKLDLARFTWRVFDHPYRKLEAHGLFRAGRLEGITVSERIDDKRRLALFLDARQIALRTAVGGRLLQGLAALEPRGWIHAWEPTEPRLREAFRARHFLANPFGRGPYSHRAPLILHYLGPDPNAGEHWLQPAAFDWQALSQD